VPIALIFVSGECPSCTELIEALDNDAGGSATDTELVLIARGSPAANAELASKYAHHRLLFDSEAAVAGAFRAAWTPAAVMISADGAVASDTRFGKAAIEALLAQKPDASPATSGGSAIGEPIPEFSAVDEGGQPVGHTTLTGSRAALLYWSPTCGYCKAMENELSRWANDPPASAPRMVLLTGHTIPLPDRFGADMVITDTDGAIARSFGLVGTPSAVLISADGTIASAVGVGADDVKALLGGFEQTR
jgi:peroxiredoxin